jgi:hypothetical protein
MVRGRRCRTMLTWVVFVSIVVCAIMCSVTGLIKGKHAGSKEVRWIHRTQSGRARARRFRS